jgi:hypothetical protein
VPRSSATYLPGARTNPIGHVALRSKSYWSVEACAAKGGALRPKWRERPAS